MTSPLNNEERRNTIRGIAGTTAAAGGVLLFLAAFILTPLRLARLTNDGIVSAEMSYILWIFRVALFHGGIVCVSLSGVFFSRRGAMEQARLSKSRSKTDLFIVSFLILFLELAFIRWLPAYVKPFSYFTNFILLACMLGMGLGCLISGKRVDFLRATPALIAATAAFALLAFAGIKSGRLPIGISGENIYYGLNMGGGFKAVQNLLLNGIIAFFIVCVTFIFIGPGQAVGRLFENTGDPIAAYCVNVGAGLAGIVCFSALSFFSVPAWAWFLCAGAALLWLLKRNGETSLGPQAVFLAAALSMSIIAGLPGTYGATLWSPYYKIVYSHNVVTVNEINHQAIFSAKNENSLPIQSMYNVPYILKRDSSGKAYDSVLIIGAGTGNDVSHALKYGARHVDVVEIDPLLLKLGKKLHPDRPYSDPRVRVINGDGRSFLLNTNKKYDLIIYGVIDSLTLMGNFSSVRLESFLFTKEALADVKRRLKPGGNFVFYNLMVENWLSMRFYKMIEDVFEQKPLLVLLPANRTFNTSMRADKTTAQIFITGDIAPIRKKFEEYGAYRIPQDANYNVNGFQPTSGRAMKPVYETQVTLPKNVETPSDDWPFLYLRSRGVPSQNTFGLLMMGLISLVFVGAFRGAGVLKGARPHFFFLGCAFMLLETESIVKLALVYGSTWFVNSIVFSCVLIMVLAANCFILLRPVRSSVPVYGLLFAALAFNYIVPLGFFLNKGWLIKNVLSTASLFLPLLFAGVVFANSFRKSKQPAADLGANLLGIIGGGILEYASLKYGYNALLLITAAMYFISLLTHPRSTD